MYKKTIKYTDYNGLEREEDFYFNLEPDEVVALEAKEQGGLHVLLEKMIQTKDLPQLQKLFRELILLSYGEKSADGREFMKVDENGKPLSMHFKQTRAFTKLYMELAFNDKAADEFVNGVIPSKEEFEQLTNAKKLSN